MKKYYYLYKAWYDPDIRRKKQKLIGNCEAIENMVNQSLNNGKKIKVRARRLARLGRRPDAAEVRGSNPRGPTKPNNIVKVIIIFQ